MIDRNTAISLIVRVYLLDSQAADQLTFDLRGDLDNAVKAVQAGNWALVDWHTVHPRASAQLRNPAAGHPVMTAVTRGDAVIYAWDGKMPGMIRQTDLDVLISTLDDHIKGLRSGDIISAHHTIADAQRVRDHLDGGYLSSAGSQA